jgi:hypothetical protein
LFKNIFPRRRDALYAAAAVVAIVATAILVRSDLNMVLWLSGQ